MTVEHREVDLRAKPASLLAYSPKGTVPVLVLADGRVLEQSLDIMHYACSVRDRDGWLVRVPEANALLSRADTEWAKLVYRAKHAERYPELSPEAHRDRAWSAMAELEARLTRHAHVSGERRGLVDGAIFPFVAELMRLDEAWLRDRARPELLRWLDAWIADPIYTQAMTQHPVWVDG